MADVLETYRFAVRGRPPKYPWDRWFDGRIWRLEAPNDFNCSARRFATSAASEATRRRYSLRITIEDEDTVVLAATKRESGRRYP